MGKTTRKELPAEVKTAWLAALRSGNYAQTRGALRRTDGFCCLGVLCDVRKDTVRGIWQIDPNNVSQYAFLPFNRSFAETAFVGLPPEAIIHADCYNGIKPSDLQELFPEKDLCGFGNVISLVKLNDVGFTFEEIALVIEVLF